MWVQELEVVMVTCVVVQEREVVMVTCVVVQELEVVMVTCSTGTGGCHGNMLLWYRSCRLSW